MVDWDEFFGEVIFIFREEFWFKINLEEFFYGGFFVDFWKDRVRMIKWVFRLVFLVFGFLFFFVNFEDGFCLGFIDRFWYKSYLLYFLIFIIFIHVDFSFYCYCLCFFF